MAKDNKEDNQEKDFSQAQENKAETQQNTGNKKNTKDQKEKKNKKQQSEAEKKIAELHKQIEELEKEKKELSDKFLRTQAEFENYKKKVARDKQEVQNKAQYDTLSSILPVLDHFDLALNAAENAKNVEKVIEGMKLIESEFQRTLTNLGVEVINATGKPFDPSVHEAVANEYSDDYEKDYVIKQWRPGYKLGNRLIRPASVVVSNGSEESAESQDSISASQEQQEEDNSNKDKENSENS